ncbi:hypothetical protein, partial [Vibrio mexicanus]|uniref:hypothetical protein n=1 Tax=Vibrio mexicanus TaxID=1004326 RepID=UPI00063CF9C4
RPDGRPGADEDAPNLIVTALEESVVEGGTEASPLYVNFEVALDGPAFAAVDVKLDTAGSAESGTDYEALEFFNTVSGQWEAVPADGTITIAASGEAVKVRAQVIDDLETEPTETVRLKASTESEHVSDRNASDVVRIEDDRGT